MISTAKKIIQLFPEATFEPPCSDIEIANAELQLGCPLPKELRTIYKNFNGFGVNGMAQRLFNLLSSHGGTSLVNKTLYLRNDPNNESNESKEILNDLVIFGMGYGNTYLGIRLTLPNAVEIYGSNMERPKYYAKTILAAYKKVLREYDA